MPSHSEVPGIWLSVWRFLLTHCLYERAAEVPGSPEFAWRGPKGHYWILCMFTWQNLVRTLMIMKTNWQKVKASSTYNISEGLSSELNANEPTHDKTNKMTVRPANSHQPGHLPSLIRVFVCAQWVAKDPRFLHADSKDWSDWQMPRLIWVFIGCTCHFVGFVMRRLKCFLEQEVFCVFLLRFYSPWDYLTNFEPSQLGGGA